MIKKATIAALAASVVMLFSAGAFAHCEVPCGIYDDEMRIRAMAEHISTIEKSMAKINELSAQRDRNYNQLVRWINNKEHHATELQRIVSQYFMTQRIRHDVEKGTEQYDAYLRKLTLLHKMLVHAMKAKQGTDPEQVRILKSLLEGFNEAYFAKPAEEAEKKEEEKPGGLFREMEKLFK